MDVMTVNDQRAADLAYLQRAVHAAYKPVHAALTERERAGIALENRGDHERRHSVTRSGKETVI